MALRPAELVAVYLERTGGVVPDAVRDDIIAKFEMLLLELEDMSRSMATAFRERWARELVRETILDSIERGLGLRDGSPRREARA